MDWDMPKQVSHKPIETETVSTHRIVQSESYRETFTSLPPENKMKVKLGEFGIPLRVVDSVQGANVTLYRYELTARGVPVSKASNYDADLQMV
jgi:hypothetical protein